jgi:predicted nucleic acid-binding protein
VLVVDASVLVHALADDGAGGAQARASLAGQDMAAPEVVDLEVLAVLRRHVRARLVEPRHGELALAELRALPLQRAAHLPLLPRIWELRDNVSAYDAAYVALAETLDVELLTADARLAAAPGLRCQVTVLR